MLVSELARIQRSCIWPRLDRQVGLNDKALRLASQHGRLAVVELLIKHGAEGLRHSWRCS